MDEKVLLTNTSSKGATLEATFAPLQGMNLTSLTIHGHQVLDVSTMDLFKQRNAGLGALIGPHFHHRHPLQIPSNTSLHLFPHVSQLPAGQKEPFSHGIARYVPWRYESSSTQIKAWLSSKDLYHGIPLKTFEGFDFEMKLEAMLLHDGLLLDYFAESSIPNVIGFHYYYPASPEALVESHVKPFVRTQSGWEGLDLPFFDKTHQKLTYPVSQAADLGFMPIQDPNSSGYTITLKYPRGSLQISYLSSNDDTTSFQLFHPKGASYVCLEPLSSLTPFAPTTKRNRLQMKLSYN